MGVLRAIADYVVPATRNETQPAGPDWRDAADTADIEAIAEGDDPRWISNINSKGPLVRNNVEQLKPQHSPFNWRKATDEVKRLSVEEAGLRHQADEIARELSDKVERRKRLNRAIIEQCRHLGCFDEIDETPIPPALPQEDQS